MEDCDDGRDEKDCTKLNRKNLKVALINVQGKNGRTTIHKHLYEFIFNFQTKLHFFSSIDIHIVDCVKGILHGEAISAGSLDWSVL